PARPFVGVTISPSAATQASPIALADESDGDGRPKVSVGRTRAVADDAQYQAFSHGCDNGAGNHQCDASRQLPCQWFTQEHTRQDDREWQAEFVDRRYPGRGSELQGTKVCQPRHGGAESG